MTVIVDPCPACGMHPAERGVLYGIDAIVCARVPFSFPLLIPDDWLRNIGFMHPMFPLDPDLASIEERCAPGLSPAARAITEASEFVLQEVSTSLWWAYQRQWVLLRDMTVRCVTPYPPPPGPISRIFVRRDPDPRLEEGAVSPTRHFGNWKNRACTPSSLREPTT